jgi:hypothetical protein
MKRAVLLIAAAALMSGCMHGVLHSPNAVVAAGAPKPTPNMDWRFAPVDDAGALTYGAAGGGDVRLLLACAHNSGEVTVGQPLSNLPDGTKSLTLVSGSTKSISAGAIQAAPGAADTQVLASKFTTMDPIIQAFNERGWISVPSGNDRLMHMVPHPGNRAVKEFFAFCR